MSNKTKKFIYYLPLLVLPAYILFTTLIGYHRMPSMKPVFDLFIFIGFTLFAGRFYCGYLCREGLAQFIPDFLSRKVIKWKFPMRMQGKSDTFARGIKYLLLIFVLIYSIIQGSLLLAFDDPNGQLEMLSKNLEWTTPGILIGAIFASFFISRSYCRYMCPIGALQGLINKIGFWKLSVNQNECIHCNKCYNQCPASLQIDAGDKVKSSECYSCLRCVSVCPRSAISVKIVDKTVNPYAYVITSVLFFISLKLIMLFLL
jgi:polyferredoxin